MSSSELQTLPPLPRLGGASEQTDAAARNKYVLFLRPGDCTVRDTTPFYARLARWPSCWLSLCTLTCLFLFGAALFIAGVVANYLNAFGLVGVSDAYKKTYGGETYFTPFSLCLNPLADIAAQPPCSACLPTAAGSPPLLLQAACLSTQCPNPLLDPAPTANPPYTWPPGCGGASGVACTTVSAPVFGPCTQCLTPAPVAGAATAQAQFGGKVISGAPKLFSGVPGYKLSASSGCSDCLNPLYDPVNGPCTSCKNPNLNPALGCLQCTLCPACVWPFCNVCPSAGYDPGTNCRTCLPQPAGQPPLTLASGCSSTRCPNANMVPPDCTSCTTNGKGVPYTLDSGCTSTECVNPLLSTSVFVYGINVLPICSTCRSNVPASGTSPAIIFVPPQCSATACSSSLFAVLPPPTSAVPGAQPSNGPIAYCSTCIAPTQKPNASPSAIPGTGCVAATCANPLAAAPDCTQCINTLQSAVSGCSACVNSLLQYPGCTSCVAPGFDPATGCATCIVAGLSPASGCQFSRRALGDAPPLRSAAEVARRLWALPPAQPVCGADECGAGGGGGGGGGSSSYGEAPLLLGWNATRLGDRAAAAARAREAAGARGSLRRELQFTPPPSATPSISFSPSFGSSATPTPSNNATASSTATASASASSSGSTPPLFLGGWTCPSFLYPGWVSPGTAFTPLASVADGYFAYWSCWPNVYPSPINASRSLGANPVLVGGLDDCIRLCNANNVYSGGDCSSVIFNTTANYTFGGAGTPSFSATVTRGISVTGTGTQSRTPPVTVSISLTPTGTSSLTRSPAVAPASASVTGSLAPAVTNSRTAAATPATSISSTNTLTGSTSFSSTKSNPAAASVTSAPTPTSTSGRAVYMCTFINTGPLIPPGAWVTPPAVRSDLFGNPSIIYATYGQYWNYPPFYASPSFTGTGTSTGSRSATATQTATASSSASGTLSRTASGTLTPAGSPTGSPAVAGGTPRPTVSQTPTLPASPSTTATLSRGSTPSLTGTGSVTPTVTPVNSPTNTASRSPSVGYQSGNLTNVTPIVSYSIVGTPLGAGSVVFGVAWLLLLAASCCAACRHRNTAEHNRLRHIVDHIAPALDGSLQVLDLTSAAGDGSYADITLLGLQRGGGGGGARKAPAADGLPRAAVAVAGVVQPLVLYRYLPAYDVYVPNREWADATAASEQAELLRALQLLGASSIEAQFRRAGGCCAAPRRAVGWRLACLWRRGPAAVEPRMRPLRWPCAFAVARWRNLADWAAALWGYTHRYACACRACGCEPRMRPRSTPPPSHPPRSAEEEREQRMSVKIRFAANSLSEKVLTVADLLQLHGAEMYHLPRRPEWLSRLGARLRRGLLTGDEFTIAHRSPDSRRLRAMARLAGPGNFPAGTDVQWQAARHYIDTGYYAAGWLCARGGGGGYETRFRVTYPDQLEQLARRVPGGADMAQLADGRTTCAPGALHPHSGLRDWRELAAGYQQPGADAEEARRLRRLELRLLALPETGGRIIARAARDVAALAEEDRRDAARSIAEQLRRRAADGRRVAAAAGARAAIDAGTAALVQTGADRGDMLRMVQASKERLGGGCGGGGCGGGGGGGGPPCAACRAKDGFAASVQPRIALTDPMPVNGAPASSVFEAFPRVPVPTLPFSLAGTNARGQRVYAFSNVHVSAPPAQQGAGGGAGAGGAPPRWGRTPPPPSSGDEGAGGDDSEGGGSADAPRGRTPPPPSGGDGEAELEDAAEDGKSVRWAQDQPKKQRRRKSGSGGGSSAGGGGGGSDGAGGGGSDGGGGRAAVAADNGGWEERWSRTQRRPYWLRPNGEHSWRRPAELGGDAAAAGSALHAHASFSKSSALPRRSAQLDQQPSEAAADMPSEAAADMPLEAAADMPPAADEAAADADATQ